MKQIIVLFRAILLGLFFISANSFAQKTIIRILDEKTLEPCPFANVILNDKNDKYIMGSTSDNNGELIFEIIEESKITISYIGYKDYNGFIKPGENKTVHLQQNFFELESVVVTGQYTPRKTDQSIYKIDVINSKTIEERGVTNLAEALSNETGIRLNVDPSTGTSIELQGMGGENIKYLIDGIPIIGRVNGNIDLSQINMENVDHIEIVQGPMSVVYGTSALAGVINIITKQNTKDKNILKINSFIDSKNNYNMGLYGSMIKGKHSISFSANRDLFQGVDINLYPADSLKHILETYGEGKDRYMEFKPKRVINADLEYAYRNEDFYIKVKSQYMDLLLKNYTNPTLVGKAYDADYYTTRSTSSITINDKIFNSLSYNIIGAYTYFNRKTDLITSNLVTLTDTITGSTSTYFKNIMTRGTFAYEQNASLSFQFGWDINYDKGEGDKIAEGAEMGDYAAFLSLQYSPFKNLTIQPGFRYIYNTVYNTPLIPSINIQWTIIEDLSFRVSYAKGFRAPSLKELYLDFKDSNHNLEGNQDLKAEKTDSYNASLAFKYKKDKHLFKIEPSFFYNDGKDAITLIVTDIETNSATNTNLGGRRTLGANINATYMNHGGLTLGAGMSRIGETFSSDTVSPIKFVPTVYYNNFSINAKYLFRKINASLMVNLKWYGETPNLAQVPEGDTVQVSSFYPSSFEIPDIDSDGYYFATTEAYQDLEVTFTKNFWKNKLSVIVGGKNLLNNYSIRNYGYLYWGQTGYEFERYNPKNYGRTFFLKLNLKIN